MHTRIQQCEICTRIGRKVCPYPQNNNSKSRNIYANGINNNTLMQSYSPQKNYQSVSANNYFEYSKNSNNDNQMTRYTQSYGKNYVQFETSRFNIENLGEKTNYSSAAYTGQTFGKSIVGQFNVSHNIPQGITTQSSKNNIKFGNKIELVNDFRGVPLQTITHNGLMYPIYPVYEVEIEASPDISLEMANLNLNGLSSYRIS